MAIITYPLNNIEYTAEDAELYHSTRTSGVFANDDFPITVSGDGNVVTIGEGIGWIRNSRFSGKVVANKTEISLDLGISNATYPRIDAVVLQFDANSNASNIVVKNGTAMTNPTPPEVVRTESVYELHLYHVYRPAGASSVVASNVTDLRSDSTYCGLMSDDVTMLGDDYVNKNMIGSANGVASLDSNGIVPKSQLPSLNYIPNSEKGAANGVAALDSNSKLYNQNMPVHMVYTKAGTASDASFGQPITFNYSIMQCGNTVFLYATIIWQSEATASGWTFKIQSDYGNSKMPFTILSANLEPTAFGYVEYSDNEIVVHVGHGQFSDSNPIGYMYIALPANEVW